MQTMPKLDMCVQSLKITIIHTHALQIRLK